MSGGEDDVVGDQGTSAESRAVDEDSELVLELAGGGQFSADDLAVELGCLAEHGHAAADRPQVSPGGGLLKNNQFEQC